MPTTKEPVTVSGVYECTDGSFVRAWWDSGKLRLSKPFATREDALGDPDAELAYLESCREAEVAAVEKREREEAARTLAHYAEKDRG